jgi:hypothetical protein
MWIPGYIARRAVLNMIATATTARHCPMGIWYLRPKNTIMIATSWPTIPSDLMKTSVFNRIPELAVLLKARPSW